MQNNSRVLKGFVSALLHMEESNIQSIQITNPIVLGEMIDEKTFILDLNILLNSNRLINIELQITDYHDWPERSLSYLCREFNQLVKGQAYIDVMPTQHISILTFTLFPEYPQFYATNMLMNVKNHQIYSDKFILSVLDLNQIRLATEEDIAYRLDYWASLFLARTWEDIKMLADKHEIIKEAATTMYAVSAEENIRLQCEARRRYEEDRVSLYHNGKLEGEQIGQQRVNQLNLLLVEANRTGDIVRAAQDKEYQQTLFTEFGI